MSGALGDVNRNATINPLLIPPNATGVTQVGTTVANGIQVGNAQGQFSDADLETIVSAAAGTQAGASYVKKNLIAFASIGGVVGLAIGYFAFRRKR